MDDESVWLLIENLRPGLRARAASEADRERGLRRVSSASAIAFLLHAGHGAGETRARLNLSAHEYRMAMKWLRDEMTALAQR